MLRKQKEEIWEKIVAFNTADIHAGRADRLFSMSLEVDISLFTAYSLRTRIENGGQLPLNEDTDPEELLQRVRNAEDVLVAQFESWKEGGRPLSLGDYAPWRDALSAYYLIAPNDVIGFAQGHVTPP